MTRAPLWKFTHNAMASEFAVFLAGPEQAYAQRAARAVFAEVDAIEGVLSRFRPDSDVARFNVAATGGQVRVSHHTAECLAASRRLWTATSGAFDPAMGCLRGLGGQTPTPALLARCGMHRVRSNAEHTILSPAVAGVELDLGAIGKGYAVDRMAQCLRDDWEIPAGLVQGGESSLFAWGDAPGHDGWQIPLRHPVDQATIVATLALRGVGLGGSGQRLHGAHIIDPRTGVAAPLDHASWCFAPSATEADALSTALMVMNDDEARACFEALSASGALRWRSSGAMTAFGAWPPAPSRPPFAPPPSTFALLLDPNSPSTAPEPLP